MNNPHGKKHTVPENQGFALVIGVIVAAVLISITYVMFSITLKQVSLSTAGKNSQISLYAADSGIECALFADNKIGNEFGNPVYDNNTGVTTAINQGDMNSFNCNGTAITSSDMTVNPSAEVTVSGTTYSALATSFYVHTSGQPCAYVTVSKYIGPGSNGNVASPKTKIESRGYNTCPDVAPGDLQRLERGLEVYY